MSNALYKKLSIKNETGIKNIKIQFVKEAKLDFKPKFSIIIPIYNAEKYLSKCLDSVINQTIKEIEIICIDDGSTDNSLEILKEYANKDNRITILTQKNSGSPARPRNVGRILAKGEYLWFIDNDDWLNLDSCKILTEIISNHNPDVIGFTVNVYDNNTGLKKQDDYRALVKISNKIFEKNLTINEFARHYISCPIEIWNKCIKRDLVINNEIVFNEKVWCMEDGLFSEECLLKASSIHYTKKSLYNYRLCNSNSCVAQLIPPNKKTYKITIQYAKESDKTRKKLKIPREISDNFVIKNLRRMRYFASIAPIGIDKKYKKIASKYINSIEFKKEIFKDELVPPEIIELAENKIFSYSTNQTYNNFHKIKNKQINFLGLKIKLQKSEFDPQAFSDSLMLKISRLQTVANVHSKTFAGFKNCNKDKSVVIVGGGPTVNNYTDIIDAKHLAINRAIIRDDINFDYFFAMDKMAIQPFLEHVINYKNKDCIKFIGDVNIGIDYQISESDFLKTDARKFYISAHITYPKFSLNIETEPLVGMHSVAFSAAQFLLYTNPKKIYLVGFDCANNGKHFAGKEHNIADRGENIIEQQKIQIKEWGMFKEFAELYYPDTQIISINPIGLKGMFKDIYTKSYLNEHPELKSETLEII